MPSVSPCFAGIRIEGSTSTQKYRNMKARLRTHAVVANARHSPRYVCAWRRAACRTFDVGATGVHSDAAQGASAKLGRDPSEAAQRRDAPNSPPAQRVGAKRGVCVVAPLGHGPAMAFPLRLASIPVCLQRVPRAKSDRLLGLSANPSLSFCSDTSVSRHWRGLQNPFMSFWFAPPSSGNRSGCPGNTRWQR